MTCSSHKFIIVHDHGKALCAVLTDKWFDNGESLT